MHEQGNALVEQAKKLADYLKQSHATVVFTGAGMSTESGLQDFRSANKGMWNHRHPLELASVHAMNENRSAFIRFYQWRMEEMLRHQPNEGHRILAKWERDGRVKGIITQNVENYHEKAGTKHVVKLHGDLGTLSCTNCQKQYDAQLYLSPHNKTTCDCGSFIRPNIVLFGEMLPTMALEKAYKWLDETDLFIVLGSSLQVSPANQFPVLAKQNGAKLVIVNHDPTPLDSSADLIIHFSIGDVLRQTDEQL